MRQRLRHLPPMLAICAVVAVLAAAGGAALAGVAGALGGLAGVGLAVGSYLASTLAIAWADSVNPQLVLPVGMAAYVTKFGLFGGVMIAILSTGWDGITPMAVGIVAGVLAWTASQIWVTYARPAADPPVAR